MPQSKRKPGSWEIKTPTDPQACDSCPEPVSAAERALHNPEVPLWRHAACARREAVTLPNEKPSKWLHITAERHGACAYCEIEASFGEEMLYEARTHSLWHYDCRKRYVQEQVEIAKERKAQRRDVRVQLHPETERTFDQIGGYLR